MARTHARTRHDRPPISPATQHNTPCFAPTHSFASHARTIRSRFSGRTHTPMQPPTRFKRIEHYNQITSKTLTNNKPCLLFKGVSGYVGDRFREARGAMRAQYQHHPSRMRSITAALRTALHSPPQPSVSSHRRSIIAARRSPPQPSAALHVPHTSLHPTQLQPSPSPEPSQR